MPKVRSESYGGNDALTKLWKTDSQILDTWQSIQVVTPPRQQVGRRGKKTYTRVLNASPVAHTPQLICMVVAALLTFAEEHKLPWSPTPIAKRKDASSSSESSEPEPPNEDWVSRSNHAGDES